MSTDSHGHRPDDIRAYDHWVCRGIGNDPLNKQPISAHTGQAAKVNDPETWADYETASQAAENLGCAGVGFVFAADDPFTGIDIDDCRDTQTGTIAPWAQKIIDGLGSYTEVSPSASGVKIWVEGQVVLPRHCWPIGGGKVEIYSEGRYFTFTGEHLEGTPQEVEQRKDELETLIAGLEASRPTKVRKTKPKASTKGKKKVPATDESVLERLREKPRCQRLLDGDLSDYHDDDSAADMALAGDIARVVGADPESIDRIFRATLLMRPKWDEVHYADGQTYGEHTIAMAIEDLDEEQADTQKEALLRLARDFPLYHTPEGEGFAVVERDGHLELLPIMGRAFARVLRQLFWRTEGKAPSATTVKDALLTLEARADFEGEEREIGVRIVEYDGAIYLDLANEQWQAVKITTEGWTVVENPCLFRRGRTMKALPTPVADGSLADLEPFLNTEDADAFVLAVAWVVGALRPSGPYAILMLQGEQGSAKSFTARLLRSLIDPAVAALRSTPPSDRELMIAAAGSWVMAYDNLSGLTPAMSDALCRLATGGGLSTRELYTNAEEVVFDATRPISVNGIDDLTGRSDLLSRSVVITLPPIEAGKRRTEKQLEAAFAKLRPRLLGALCDAVSTAMRRLPEVHLDNPPRMSDFASWVVAAEEALPWESGHFLKAYEANQQAMSALALEMDRVAIAIIRMMQSNSKWSGTATQLLDAVRGVPGLELRGRDIPGTPRGLSNRVHRLAPLLRERGLDVQFHKGTERVIVITNADGPPDMVTLEGVKVRVRKPCMQTTD